MEGNILLEEGKYDDALQIFQNMDDASYYHTSPYFYAPIKFSIAYILEIKGEKQKAYDLFKYFLSIYEDCDPFYQKNVQTYHLKSGYCCESGCRPYGFHENRREQRKENSQKKK